VVICFVMMPITFVADDSAKVSFLRPFRLLLIVRIIKRARGLKLMVTTLFASIPALLNVGAMLFLLFFLYAIIGMQLWANVKFGMQLGPHANFREFGTAMLLLFRFLTGENWNLIMLDCMVEPPHCTPYKTDLAGFFLPDDCGSEWLALLYFISFYCISTYTVINLLVAIIVDNFGFCYNLEQAEVSRDVLANFNEVWYSLSFPYVDKRVAVERNTKFDQEFLHGLYLPLSLIKELMMRVGKPLGIDVVNKYAETRFQNVLDEARLQEVPRVGIHITKMQYILALHAAGMDPLPFDDWVGRTREIETKEYNMASENLSRVMKGFELRRRNRGKKQNPDQCNMVTGDWLLQVTILQARGLLAMDFNGKSDPYCVVSHGRDVVSTAVKPACLECRYDETFFFTFDGIERLTIDMFDYDFIGGDDMMGKLIVTLEDFKKTDVRKQWYPLRPPYMSGESCGEIEVEMKLIDGTRFRDKVLDVTVHGARNLIAADWNISKANSSDPYAKIRHGLRQRALTDVVYQDLNPSWESYHVFWFRPAYDLTVEIFDQDKGLLANDDFLGQVKLPLRQLELNTPIRGWHKLQSEDQIVEPDSVNLGEVEITIEMRDGSHYKDTVLEVTVVSAKDVASMDSFGKSDVFVDVEHGRQKSRTQTCFNTLAPEWNATLCFDYKPLVDLSLFMYDHDNFFFFQRSQYMGQVKIPVNRLEFQKPEHRWLHVTGADDTDTVSRGQLELILNWTDGTKYKDSKIQVTVIQGRNLKSMDMLGSSDPYPLIQHDKQVRKGVRMINTLEPTWNFSSRLEFSHINQWLCKYLIKTSRRCCNTMTSWARLDLMSWTMLRRMSHFRPGFHSMVRIRSQILHWVKSRSESNGQVA